MERIRGCLAIFILVIVYNLFPNNLGTKTALVTMNSRGKDFTLEFIGGQTSQDFFQTSSQGFFPE